jgi:hypothetical protein
MSKLALMTAVSLMFAQNNQPKFDDDYDDSPKLSEKTVEPKNKFSFTEEELETYRNLSKRERKDFLKNRKV